MIDSNYYIGIITINTTVLAVYFTLTMAKNTFFNQKFDENFIDIETTFNDIFSRLYRKKAKENEIEYFEENIDFFHELISGNLQEEAKKTKESSISEIHDRFFYNFKIIHSKIDYTIEGVKINEEYLMNIVKEHDIKSLEIAKKTFSTRRLSIEKTFSYFDRYIYLNGKTINDIIEEKNEENEERLKKISSNSEAERLIKNEKYKSHHIYGLQKELKDFSNDLLDTIIKLEKSISYLRKIEKTPLIKNLYTVIFHFISGIFFPLFSILYSKSLLEYTFLSVFLVPLICLSSVILIFWHIRKL